MFYVLQFLSKILEYGFTLIQQQFGYETACIRFAVSLFISSSMMLKRNHRVICIIILFSRG